MSGKYTLTTIKCRLFLWSIASLGLIGCAGAPPSVLDPRGPAASQLSDLSWLFFVLGALVWVAVVGFLLAALFRRGREKSLEVHPRRPAEDAADTRFVTVTGVVIPAVLLIVSFGLTLNAMTALATPHIPKELSIEVIGHQWWWEVRYPDRGFTTANELRIPVGQPVEVRLTSIDVIHSFWVPQLNGKLDLVPGQTNTYWLQADQPGEYVGVCAEFCGLQHARMKFVVVAESPDQFAVWLDEQAQPAASLPVDDALRKGQEVFLSSACVYCHTIRGTNASGTLGPDLTHIGSRRTIGAGILPNTRGTLGGWIVDPQRIKPGNLMPPTNLSGPNLQLLLDYPESLE